MATQKRSHEEVDPDYTDIEEYQAKRQRELEENAQATVKKKIENIIIKEFTTEINSKERELQLIDQRLNEARLMMDRLRACIVANYYGMANQSAASSQASSLVAPPASIHPAVKKLIGKRPAQLPADKNLSQDSWEPVSACEGRINLSEKVNKIHPESPPVVTSGNGGNTSGTFSLSESQRVAPVQTTSSSQADPSTDDRRSRFKLKKKIIVGNVSKYIPVDQREHNDLSSHKWMVYVRGPKSNPNISGFVKKVLFFLHHSYKPNDLLEITSPPFHLTRRGWGEFPVRVQLHFVDSRNKKVDIIHNLKLDKTYSGLQTMGGETFAEIQLENNFYDVNGTSQQGSLNVQQFPALWTAPPSSTSSSSLISSKNSRRVAETESASSSSAHVSLCNDKPKESGCKLTYTSDDVSDLNRKGSNNLRKDIAESRKVDLYKLSSGLLEMEEEDFDLNCVQNAEAVSSPKCLTNGNISAKDKLDKSAVDKVYEESMHITIAHEEHGKQTDAEEMDVDVVSTENTSLGPSNGKIRAHMMGRHQGNGNGSNCGTRTDNAPETGSSSQILCSTPNSVTEFMSGSLSAVTGVESRSGKYSPPVSDLTSSSSSSHHKAASTESLGKICFQPISHSNEVENSTTGCDIPVSSTRVSVADSTCVSKSIAPVRVVSSSLSLSNDPSRLPLMLSRVPVTETDPNPGQVLTVIQNPSIKKPALKSSLSSSSSAYSLLSSPTQPVRYQPPSSSSSSLSPSPLAFTASTSSSVLTSPLVFTTSGQLVPSSSKGPVMAASARMIPSQAQRSSPQISLLDKLPSKLLPVISASAGTMRKPMMVSLLPSSIHNHQKTENPAEVVLMNAKPCVPPSEKVTSNSSTLPKVKPQKQVSLLTGKVVMPSLLMASATHLTSTNQKLSAAVPLVSAPSSHSVVVNPVAALNQSDCKTILLDKTTNKVIGEVPKGMAQVVLMPAAPRQPHPNTQALPPNSRIIQPTHLILNQNYQTGSSEKSKQNTFSLLNSSLVPSPALLNKPGVPHYNVITSDAAPFVKGSGKHDSSNILLESSSLMQKVTGEDPSPSQASNVPVKMSAVGITKYGKNYRKPFIFNTNKKLVSDEERKLGQYKILQAWKKNPEKYAMGYNKTKKISNVKQGVEEDMDDIGIPPLDVTDHPDLISLTKAALRLHPLVKTGVNRQIHPYCAQTLDQWTSWPVGKQRASEWHRACFVLKYIKFCLSGQSVFKGQSLMTTRQLVLWSRLHLYSPNVSVKMISLKEEAEDERDPLTVHPWKKAHREVGVTSSYTAAGPLDQELLNTYEHLDHNDDDDDDACSGSLDVVSIEPVSVPMKTEDPDPCEGNSEWLCPSDGAVFVNEQLRKRGILLAPVELEPGVMASTTAEILFSTMMQFGTNLIREAAAIGDGRSMGLISLEDIHNALSTLPETTFCSGKYLGKEEEADVR